MKWYEKFVKLQESTWIFQQHKSSLSSAVEHQLQPFADQKPEAKAVDSRAAERRDRRGQKRGPGDARGAAKDRPGALGCQWSGGLGGWNVNASGLNKLFEKKTMKKHQKK